MTINFLVRLNRKKSPRIEVVRRVTEEGKKPTLKSLGNLPADLNQAYGAFADKLDEDEQFHLINKIGNLQFNQHHFNTSPGSDVEREMVDLAPPFYQALKTLMQLAYQHQLDLNPSEVMLTALLNKAHRVQQALTEKLGKEVNILEQLGVKTPRYDKEEMKARFHTGGQELFKALTELKVPLGEVADKFRLIAHQHYGKSTKLNKKIIEEYASKPSRYSLWYCGVAIDVLHFYGKNPLTVLPPKKIFEHWAWLRVKDKSFTDLKIEFFKQFGISKTAQAEMSPLLDEVYHFLVAKHTEAESRG